MAFDFGDTSDPTKIGNRSLRHAIAALTEDPCPKRRKALYESLNRGPLLIAIKKLPDELKEGVQILSEDVELEFLTSEDPDGGAPVILAFTDMDAVNARVPDSPFIALDPHTVLSWVIEKGYSGIILNPDGPWAGIPREDIEVLLSVDNN